MVGLMIVSGCTNRQPKPLPPPPPPDNEPGWTTMCQQRSAPDRSLVPKVIHQDVARPPLGPPEGKGAVPTNQWWSSLLSVHPEQLWAYPLIVSWTPEGVGLAVPRPTATANTIFAGSTTPLVIVLPATVPRMEDYGDFHVVVGLAARDKAQGTLMVAQGSPATWLTVADGGLTFDAPDRSIIRSPAGKALGSSKEFRADEVRVTAPDNSSWTVVLPRSAKWKVTGRRVHADVSAGSTVGFVARPDGASNRWDALAKHAGMYPVTGTQAAWRRAPGAVTQRLTWLGDPGVAVQLPHQVTAATTAATVGTFPSPRGTMTVVAQSTFRWEAPLPGVILGVPPLPDNVAQTVREGLASDPDPAVPAGAYFGAKALGRMATQADLALAVDPIRGLGLLERLGKELTNSLVRAEGADDRWVGYDHAWGGLQAMPPQFGSETYNDHNFQNGYLLQAAATLVERGVASVDALRPILDVVVADIGTMQCNPGFPPFRVMNAYQGHSNASGFAPFLDGNNSESSSEGVHAWWSMARWAFATGQTELGEQALLLYATEAATARWYWLGEQGKRHDGYRHTVAGIVWGGKIDFATWFDPKPASIVGIQLLPFTFGSLYRANPAAAAERFVEGSAGSGTHWSDLLALDLALSDPAKAAEVVAKAPAIEEGNSRAFSNAWIGWLASVGPPDVTVFADPPFGHTFRTPDGRVTYAVANPTASDISVVFTKDGKTVATVAAQARTSVVQ